MRWASLLCSIVKSWKSLACVDFHSDPSWEMIQFENIFSTAWLEPPTSNWFFLFSFCSSPKLLQVTFHTWMFHCWAIPYHAVSPRLTWTTVMERFKAKQAISMCPGTNMFEDGMNVYTGYTWVFMFS